MDEMIFELVDCCLRRTSAGPHGRVEGLIQGMLLYQAPTQMVSQKKYVPSREAENGADALMGLGLLVSDFCHYCAAVIFRRFQFAIHHEFCLV